MRRRMLARRSSLEPRLAEDLAKRAAGHLFSSDIWRQSRVAAVFVSLPHEFSTKAIMERAWRENKVLLCPKVADPEKRHMFFARCRQFSDLRPGYRGILEPISSAPYALDGDALLLAPGLAFDRQGWRLGYGGGFYDAYLAGLPVLPTAIGLCFSMQLLEHTPHDGHDIPMNGICSDAGLIWI